MVSSTLPKTTKVELQQNCQLLIDALPVLISYFDRDEHYRFNNKAYEDWFGRSTTEITGRHLKDVLGGDAYRMIKPHVDSALGGKPVSFELLLPYKDAGSRHVQANYVPHFAGDKDVRGVFVLVSDVTEKKRVEQALRSAKDEAEKANRGKSDFLARMSHDLRTPLNAIIGFSEVIMNEKFGPVGERTYAEYARDIHESGHHLLELVNDLLDISRIESEQYKLKCENLDLSEFATSVNHWIEHDLARKQLTLKTEFQDGLPQLRADPRAMKQMLLNLLSNAVKFTPNGGEITVEAGFGPDGLTIVVKDTGLGIKRPDLNLVLMPFGQVDNSLAQPQKGSGLGLPIVKSLVELHGGHINLQSALGVGTCVTLHFPPDRVIAGTA